MRLRSVSLALLAVATLAGCGPGQQERTVHNPQTGEKVTVRSGPAVAAPKNLPAYAALYPGAVIESSMDGVSSGQEGGQRGGMITFRVTAPPEKVIAFYRDRLKGSTLSERNEANINGALILSGATPGDNTAGMQVSVVRMEDGGGSHVTLIYNLGRG